MGTVEDTTFSITPKWDIFKFESACIILAEISSHREGGWFKFKSVLAWKLGSSSVILL